MLLILISYVFINGCSKEKTDDTDGPAIKYSMVYGQPDTSLIFHGLNGDSVGYYRDTFNIYTGGPDTTISLTYFELDLDNDDTTDLLIRDRHWFHWDISYGYGLYMIGLNGTRVVVKDNAQLNYLKMFHYGDQINMDYQMGGITAIGTHLQMIDFGRVSPDNLAEYIGFISDDKSGWVKLRFSNSSDLDYPAQPSQIVEIVEWAYIESTDKVIVAGQLDYY